MLAVRHRGPVNDLTATNARTPHCATPPPLLLPPQLTNGFPRTPPAPDGRATRHEPKRHTRQSGERPPLHSTAPCQARKQDRRRNAGRAQHPLAGRTRMAIGMPGSSCLVRTRTAPLRSRPKLRAPSQGRKHPTAGAPTASAASSRSSRRSRTGRLRPRVPREKRNMRTAPGCFGAPRSTLHLGGNAIAAAGTPGRGKGAAPLGRAAPRTFI